METPMWKLKARGGSMYKWQQHTPAASTCSPSPDPSPPSSTPPSYRLPPLLPIDRRTLDIPSPSIPLPFHPTPPFPHPSLPPLLPPRACAPPIIPSNPPSKTHPIPRSLQPKHRPRNPATAPPSLQRPVTVPADHRPCACACTQQSYQGTARCTHATRRRDAGKCPRTN